MMKINKDFLLHNTGSESILVPTGNAGFSGVVRGNKTLGAVLELLKSGHVQRKWPEKRGLLLHFHRRISLSKQESRRNRSGDRDRLDERASRRGVTGREEAGTGKLLGKTLFLHL